MKIITTTENIKQLLKEQRELCANRAMKEKLSMYYAKDIRKIICSAPEPEIKKYKILNEAPDEIRDVMDNKDEEVYCPICGWLLPIDKDGKKYCITENCKFNG